MQRTKFHTTFTRGVFLVVALQLSVRLIQRLFFYRDVIDKKTVDFVHLQKKNGFEERPYTHPNKYKQYRKREYCVLLYEDNYQ